MKRNRQKISKIVNVLYRLNGFHAPVIAELLRKQQQLEVQERQVEESKGSGDKGWVSGSWVVSFGETWSGVSHDHYSNAEQHDEAERQQDRSRPRLSCLKQTQILDTNKQM